MSEVVNILERGTSLLHKENPLHKGIRRVADTLYAMNKDISLEIALREEKMLKMIKYMEE